MEELRTLLNEFDNIAQRVMEEACELNIEETLEDDDFYGFEDAINDIQAKITDFQEKQNWI
jgi:hypothetical protein